MKKLILTQLLFITICTLSFGQFVIPVPIYKGWKVTGDNISAFPYGNVGIGTDLPKAKLDIFGDDISLSTGEHSLRFGIESMNTETFYGANYQMNINGENVFLKTGLWYAEDDKLKGPTIAWGGEDESLKFVFKQSNNAIAAPQYVMELLEDETALILNGDAEVNGIFYGSDRRYKRNIQTIPEALPNLIKVEPVSYHYRTEDFPEKNFTKKETFGFIAQDIVEIFPELVHENRNGYLSVNYTALIPVLVQGFKEQQQIIEQQVDDIELLKQQVQALMAKSDVTLPLNINTYDGESQLRLDQNVPNPFSKQTKICYYIPNTSKIKDVQLIIYDENGKILYTKKITERGEGCQSLSSEGYSTGNYFYALTINGKTFQSKRMVFTR